jgi:predicted transcriptional regulator
MLITKRDALDMTQARLAALIGEQQSLVARLESGQRRVDVVEFLDLAVALRFDPVEVLVWLREMG